MRSQRIDNVKKGMYYASQHNTFLNDCQLILYEETECTMSNVVQVQQAQQAVKTASPRLTASCTPILPGWSFHVSRSDFRAICANDRVNRDALRIFETETNRRIQEYRSKHGVPGDHLPHEDDLWISDLTLDDLEYLSGQVHGRSSYQFCLLDTHGEGKPPTLIELGFLRKRRVAWAGINAGLPDTAIYVGKRGKYDVGFILVDSLGHYIDSQGELRKAADDGYGAVERQFLYEIEAVNAALAALDDHAPPKAVPRWRSLQRKKKEHRLPSGDDESTTGDALANDPRRHSAASQGGSKSPLSKGVSFDFKNNTEHAALSSNGDEQSMRFPGQPLEKLRVAPWTPETLIGLTAQLLAVPDPATCDEDAWDRDWAAPAQWCIDQCADVDARYAWPKIERHIAGMLSGPTWYAQRRARATPFTLRHIVSNWRVVEDELRRANWYPDAHIEYDGPAFDDYAQGYGSQEVVAQPIEAPVYIEAIAHDDDAQARTTQPLPDLESAQSAQEGCAVVEAAQSSDGTQATAQPSLRKRSLRKKDAAQRLATMIYTAHPLMHVEIFLIAAHYVVSIETAQDQWYDFEQFTDWLAPTAHTLAAIAQAERYGRQRSAAHSNGPPGAAQGGGDGS